VSTWHVGDWTITRVADPAFDLTLPQDDATMTTLQRSPWLQPDFATDEWSLRVGSSALLLTGPGPRIVVDPWLAFDALGDNDARLDALTTAGVAPDEVDVVINSHNDQVGANGRFPNATTLLPAAEPPLPVDCESAEDRRHVAPGVEIIDLPGHNAGHVGVEVAGGAVIVGHLFLHPAQVANPTSVLGDRDPEQLVATRIALLKRAVADDLLLIGPLWAAPGGGYVARDGDAWRLRPA
jgi:glyoxylase-like metal-dependent hydrolase (beta-lactamase superfamily II)